MYKSTILASLLVAGLLASISNADVTIGTTTWTTPIAVSGPNARQQAESIARRMGGRLPTMTEFQTYAPQLRRYAEFNRPLHVFFTATPAWQWHVMNNAAHRDGGRYYGFDLVTVIIERPGHGSPFPPGGLLNF